MKQSETTSHKHANRRSFLKKGMVAGAATLSAGMLSKGLTAFGADHDDDDISKGDAAILRFLAAAEIVETDLWEQYTDLGEKTLPIPVTRRASSSSTATCRSTSRITPTTN